ncbi:MAG: hypothetical protein HKM89_15400 [Gemmatimonadales bacterium]|nr:hypothetical protein [Gemmatimonadales bacterium]
MMARSIDLLSPAWLIALAMWGGAPAPAPPASPGVDLIGLRLAHLRLDLAIDYDKRRLDGMATLEVENASDEPVLLIPLLLYRLMTVSEITDQGGTPVAFTQDIVTLEDWPQYQANHITIILDSPIEPGERGAVRVTYGGYLAGFTETGMGYVRDHINRDFTILREDALAFPVLGVLSWEQNRAAPRAPFAFGVRITVPEDLTVAAGGEFVARTVNDGSATFEYRSVLPADFVNIAIAPYRLLESQGGGGGGGARIFYLPDDSVGARRVLSRLDQALAFLEERFGPLGAHPGLTVIEIPEGFGSQASLAAGIIQTRDAFNDPSQHRQFYHELSHLWNAPDLDAPSPRWNEGLASFLERRLAAELDGWGELESYMEEAARGIVERFEENPSYLTTPFIDYGKASLTGLSYRVGMLMFYALYELTGPEAFDAAIGGYFQRYRQSGGTTEAFVEFFQESTSARLEGFFDDWLSTTQWVDRLRAAGSVEAMVAEYRGTTQ